MFKTVVIITGGESSRLKPFDLSGHIRDVTPCSLRDLSAVFDFQPTDWWVQNDGLFPAIMRNICIVASFWSPYE
jgi:hypothetical protein